MDHKLNSCRLGECEREGWVFKDVRDGEGGGGGMVERIIDHYILCGNVIKLTLSICQCQCHSGPKKCLPMSCISALSLLVVVLLEWVGTDIALSCYIAIPASLLSITLLHNTLQFLTFTTVNTTFHLIKLIEFARM